MLIWNNNWKTHVSGLKTMVNLLMIVQKVENPICQTKFCDIYTET